MQQLGEAQAGGSPGPATAVLRLQEFSSDLGSGSSRGTKVTQAGPEVEGLGRLEGNSTGNGRRRSAPGKPRPSLGGRWCARPPLQCRPRSPPGAACGSCSAAAGGARRRRRRRRQRGVSVGLLCPLVHPRRGTGQQQSHSVLPQCSGARRSVPQHSASQRAAARRSTARLGRLQVPLCLLQLLLQPQQRAVLELRRAVQLVVALSLQGGCGDRGGARGRGRRGVGSRMVELARQPEFGFE